MQFIATLSVEIVVSVSMVVVSRMIVDSTVDVYEKGDSTLVVTGIEVVMRPEVIFPEGLMKNDVNTAEVATIAAMYKVAIADNSEAPFFMELNLFCLNKILTI